METQTHPMLQQTSRSNLGGGRDKNCEACHLSHSTTLPGSMVLSPHLYPAWEPAVTTKQTTETSQNRIIAVRKCPGLVLAQDNSGHLQWLHSFCAHDILHDTSTGSHKVMMRCVHNLDFVPWTQIYDLIPGSQIPSMCSHSRSP